MQAVISVGLGSAVHEILGFELDNDGYRGSWMMSIASISGAEPVRAPVRIAHSFPHLTTLLSKYRILREGCFTHDSKLAPMSNH